jgi:hypothetical protein
MAIQETCEFLGYGGRRKYTFIEAYEERSSKITITIDGQEIVFMNKDQFRTFLKMLTRFDERV